MLAEAEVFRWTQVIQLGMVLFHVSGSSFRQMMQHVDRLSGVHTYLLPLRVLKFVDSMVTSHK